MRETPTPELYGPDERAALAFAEALTLRSGEVPPDVREAMERRWTPSEIVEIAAVAGLFNYFNRFNNALCVPPTEPSRYLEEEDASPEDGPPSEAAPSAADVEDAET